MPKFVKEHVMSTYRKKFKVIFIFLFFCFVQFGFSFDNIEGIKIENSKSKAIFQIPEEFVYNLLKNKIEENKNKLKTMILELPQPEIAFFNESDLIFVCESKFLLPNYNIILSLWFFEGDFFLIYVIFNNSKFDKLFGIPMITSLDEIEKNFQYSSIFKQIERFNIPKISAFIYDYNHDGIDDILYLGVSYMTGYIHFIISGLSINLEKIEMFNIGKFPNFQVYPEFINYKCRQGIKYFDGEQFVFYYYDRIKQEYVQDETAISEELEQIHGSPDFFAEAGIDYTKLERPLLSSDLEGFSKPALRIWRNAIYARHGRTFKSEDLQALFNEYAWYKPDENYSDEKLTDIDKANIKLIQEFEKNKK